MHALLCWLTTPHGRSNACSARSARAARWVPVNARNTGAETVQVLNRTDTDIIFYGSAFESGMDELLAQCPRISLAIAIDGGVIDDAPQAGSVDRRRQR